MAVAASLLLQCLALGAAIVVPLVYTYEIPIEEWARTALVFTPPAPPRPASPKVPESLAERPPARFAQTLEAPKQFPDTVAIYEESRNAIRGMAAPDLGILGGATGGVADGVLGVTAPAEVEVPPPVRVGGLVQAAKIVHRVTPVYPAEATEKGIEGEVRLEAVINVAGAVRQIKVISGDPLLAASAVDAVSQWRYRATTLNGVAVEVITSVVIHFKLAAPPPPPPEEKNKKKRRR